MHRTVATVVAADLDAVTAAVQDDAAELIEVRLDALWPELPPPARITDDLLAISQAAEPTGARLLATLRPERQGGGFRGDEAVRLGLLAAAADAGFSVVDVEGDHEDQAATVRALRRHDTQIIVSDHGLTDCPSRDVGLRRLQAMQDAGGDVEKMAVPVGSFLDQLRCFELVHAHRLRHGNPAIAPLGGGPMLRAGLAVAGNALTYGHHPDNPPAVPGQPGIADVRAVLDHWGLGRRPHVDSDHPAWFAVIGDPVEHSLSPRIHNAALEEAGRSERYAALQVPDSIGAVRLLTTVAGRIGLAGASVTAPLKRHALDACTPDATATAVGAVNCLRFTDGVHGTNTDATALVRLLAECEGGDLAVVGAGGAARAALFAGAANGMELTFTSRDPDRAGAVASDTGATWVPWADRESIQGFDAIVQATPVSDPAPLDPDGAAIVIEMVYRDGPTALEGAAHDAGVPVVDGRRVLVEQAVDAFRFWTGTEPDADEMLAALEAMP